MEYSLRRWTIVLGPGERADVLVAPRLDGQNATLITNPFNRGSAALSTRSTEDLIVFQPASMRRVPAADLPKVTRDIPAMSADGATPIAIDLVMTKAQGVTGFALEGGHSGGSRRCAQPSAKNRCGRLRTRQSGRIPSICTGSSFRKWMRRAFRCARVPEGHDPRAGRCDETFSRHAGQARLVDVPLPHPGSRRSRSHEHG